MNETVQETNETARNTTNQTVLRPVERTLKRKGYKRKR